MRARMPALFVGVELVDGFEVVGEPRLAREGWLGVFVLFAEGGESGAEVVPAAGRAVVAAVPADMKGGVPMLRAASPSRMLRESSTPLMSAVTSLGHARLGLS